MSNTTPVAGCRVRWLLLAGLLATLSCAQAERVVHRFDVERPRDFGYLLGDVLETRVHLEMAASHELVADKLPEGARISRWLEQDPIEIESTVGSELRRYDMLLRYRVVATPSEVQAVEVPALTLDVSGPGHLFALAIPAWAFTLGPLLPIREVVEGVPLVLREPRPPGPVPTGGALARIAVLATGMLVALAYLAWLHLRLPWLERGNGPFARAERDLARLGRRTAGQLDYRAALTRIHRAFDETAGRTLFERDVGAFLVADRRFAGLGDGIAEFYALSSRCFYLPGDDPPQGSTEIAALRRFCRACRDAERGLS